MKTSDRRMQYLKQVFLRVQKHIQDGFVVTFDGEEVKNIDFDGGVYLKHDTGLYSTTEIYSDCGNWEDMTSLTFKEIKATLGERLKVWKPVEFLL